MRGRGNINEAVAWLSWGRLAMLSFIHFFYSAEAWAKTVSLASFDSFIHLMLMLKMIPFIDDPMDA